MFVCFFYTIQTQRGHLIHSKRADDLENPSGMCFINLVLASITQASLRNVGYEGQGHQARPAVDKFDVL